MFRTTSMSATMDESKPVPVSAIVATTWYFVPRMVSESFVTPPTAEPTMTLCSSSEEMASSLVSALTTKSVLGSMPIRRVSPVVEQHPELSVCP